MGKDREYEFHENANERLRRSVLAALPRPMPAGPIPRHEPSRRWISTRSMAQVRHDRQNSHDRLRGRGQDSLPAMVAEWHVIHAAAVGHSG